MLRIIIMHNAWRILPLFFLLLLFLWTGRIFTRRETIGIHVLLFSPAPHTFSTSFLGILL